ncbi:MAG: M48 family metalloprotease [Nitrospirales bacterium]|nr:M48 family metalloprotease [Nitrospira sp.]MDR4499962.1 M48 family metalloprotease [Nitrospirales bacterium]
MDFFGHQDQARRKTRWLQSLFALAVTVTIVGIYWTILGTMSWIEWRSALETDPSLPFSWDFFWRWDLTLFSLVGLFCLIVIALGCAIKFMELHAGGAWAAELLGGKRLDPSSPSDAARILINVVEEMALASGMAPPPVYVLEQEKGINAFAAGYTADDAVIGVTRGAMTQLTRDELQGVIGHEFSHILHGDMRLNLEMIGLLYGLQGLGALGRTMLNWSLNYSAHTSNFFTPVHGLSIVLSLLVGGALRVVGSIGVVLASMVKAAVSRQREFLADASAIQFTRNPEGLGNALKKIGNVKEGSIVHHPEAPQISHMFFSHGLLSGLETLFATHPPLITRIRRIDPTFSVQPPSSHSTQTSHSSRATDRGISFASASSAGTNSYPAYQQPTPDSIVDQIGASHPRHVNYIHTLLSRVPPVILEAVHEPFGARAVIYALLLSSDAQTRAIQVSRLASHADHVVYQETLKLEPVMQNLELAARLPLIDLVIPTLKLLSEPQYSQFKANVRNIIPQKNQGALFGWTLRRVMLRHLDPHFYPAAPFTLPCHSLKRIAHHCGDLLSALAHYGKGNNDDVMRAFRAGKQELKMPSLTLAPASQCTLASLDLTLYALARTTPEVKRTIIKACTACILADRHVTLEEGELLRAVADSLGCPMPPVFAALPQRLPSDVKNAASSSPDVPKSPARTTHGASHDHTRHHAKIH